ncbi:hypothetical protein E4U42_005436 [Claviceps africana]|uniref:tRNA(Ile)-lysidine synthetase n=1 Tax=Claviceps africana TaxID=83212 RepID=A0A8K0J9U9_9HYPO|nr:hypothetical protein E4U42_005436 [Claviceps africana]
MAMAHLFSAMIKTYPAAVKIADNPVHKAIAIIVDHKLRPESSSEASEVAQELRRMGVVKPVIKPLNWKEFAPRGQDPAGLPNVESAARTLRYRMLGQTCRTFHVSSLFFAHHRDDQFETILMRLQNRHPYRGLQGIREANAIPECHDLHGVYKSGLLDDQMHKDPYLSFKPPKKEMRRLRWTLKSDSEAEPWDQIRFCLGVNDLSGHFSSNIPRDLDSRMPYLTPLNCEDGGVMIYRPLLQFDKDRLIATCEANKIKWFEDPTNEDVTLTPRNKIRRTIRTAAPAEAEQQKRVILDMSRDARRRVRLEEAEARRWLTREAVILDFDPNAGTLRVRLSPFRVANPHWGRGRLFAQARRASRQPHQRVIAAIVIRKLIEFVTPEANLPSLANMDNMVDRLFPELAAQTHESPSPSPPAPAPKAFTMAGVAFDPLVGPSGAQWFLSRAPYPSTKPLPERKLLGDLHSPTSPLVGATDESVSRHHHWRTWKTPKLWDGRYWIRVSACVRARFHILPLMPQHAKPFRKALSPPQRARLDRLLKYYAPGKVRYALPALYSVQAVPGQEADPTLTLLALPSLGIHAPGLDRWVKCETRYRWVDISLLGLGTRGRQGPVVGGGGRTGPHSMRIREQRAARPPARTRCDGASRRGTRSLRLKKSALLP